MRGRVAAIGTFDGVHTGHRSVLKVLTDYAKEHDLDPVAITFETHPLKIIDPSRIPSELTPLWKKRNLLLEVGVTPMVLKFDETMRDTTARDWMRFLKTHHNVKALVIGYDNTFGKDGINLSLDDYRKIGKEEGVEILTAEEIKGVSSSAIRKAVKAGEIEKAHRMLGRPYSITSQVVRGNGLGHTLGFPTANIDLPNDGAIPKPGVYAGIVKTLEDGVKHPAMINIGKRPTVMRGNDVVIEAHVINWEGNLYGKDITVRFLKRLRDEQKFDSIEALKQQLRKDLKETLDLILPTLKV